MIHDAFKKNPLTNATFSLNVSFGTSKSYSRMENTTHEYAGSRIASGGNTNVTAGERDLTVKGSAVTGSDVSLAAKGNVRLEAGENTSITSTENKFSSASIGASFTPQGLSDISVNANKANGNSKESVTAYSPTLVAAENNLSLTSGKDMDIIGSKAQGDRITAKVGGNLSIETLQEKETYEEHNSSTGFGISWGVNQTKNKTTDASGNTKIETLRSFSKPTFSASWNKGNIDSHYRSARQQAGFFAGSGGFDIYVEKNTDLKGGVIASKASPDKNKLSTGTLSFSDLKNEADYSAKSIGASYHKYGNYDDMTKDEQDKVYNTKGLAPNLSMPVKGDASSTTKAAIARGTIDIRENPTQDISALSRDTANSLNELGKIFDKAKIEERQELAAVFGEEAFRLLHNMKDDGSGRKIAAHAIIGGLVSQITGASFASGAIGAGLNEALIKSLKGLDPGTAQMISAIIGAAAAKAIGGNALAGASAAASGTKWNLLSEADYNEKERRFREAPNWIEQNKIFDEYLEKDLAQEKNEEAEREALEAEGWTATEIDDYFNNVRYPNYVTFNGYTYYRLGETIIRPYPTHLFWDFVAGIAYSTDENMSFGVMRELYKGISGHYPYTSKTNIHYLGRAVGDIVSMGAGSLEIASGFGAIGGGIEAGASGAGAVATPALTAAGAAAVVHGGTSVVRASQNFADDISNFNASTSRSETTLNDIQSKLSGLGTKNERYIKKRGWSIDSIKDVIQHPHTTRKAFNKSTGSEATVYYNKQGDYVVIDNNTKELIQTSKYGDKNWIPDSTIQDPYKPHN